MFDICRLVRIPSNVKMYWPPITVAALILATFPGCGRVGVVASKQTPAPATPDPHEQALIERTVRERLAEEDRITEQQLVNARAAAAQRMVGVQMFRDLEGQYRERQEAMANDAAQTVAPSPSSEKPAAGPDASDP